MINPIFRFCVLTAATLLSIAFPPLSQAAASSIKQKESTDDAITTPWDAASILYGSGGRWAALMKDGRLIHWKQSDKRRPVEFARGIKKIFPGYDNNWFALTNDGRLITWPEDGYHPLPPPKDLHNVTSIETVGSCGFATLEDGHIIGWGTPEGSRDNLLDLFNISRFDLTSLRNIGNITYIGGGSWAALTKDGDIVFFGYGATNPARDKKPKDLPKLIQIFYARGILTALGANGDVIRWGSDEFRAGDDRVIDQSKVMPPENLQEVKTIKFFGFFFDNWAAILNQGRVVCWGSNNYGQCNAPKDLCNVKKLCFTSQCWAALTENGHVVCWGNNRDGLCDVPKDLCSVKDIYAGSGCWAALTEDGHVICWGDNRHDQCNAPKNLCAIKSLYHANSCWAATTESGGTIFWGEYTRGTRAFDLFSIYSSLSGLSSSSPNLLEKISEASHRLSPEDLPELYQIPIIAQFVDNILTQAKTTTDYDFYIEKFRGAPNYSHAIKARFALTEKENTLEAYNTFIQKYPAVAAQAIAAKYILVEKINTLDGYDAFIEKHLHSPEAASALAARYTLTEKENSIKAYDAFILKYPSAAAKAITAKYTLVKNSNTADLYDTFIKTHPDSPEAQKALADRYALAATQNTPESYDTFLARYSTSAEAPKALAAAYALAAKPNTIPSYAAFQAKHPNSPEATKAITEIYTLTIKPDFLEGYYDFVKKYPNAPEAPQAQRRIYELLYALAENANTTPAYLDYLKSITGAPADLRKKALNSSILLEVESATADFDKIRKGDEAGDMQLKERIARGLYQDAVRAKEAGDAYTFTRKYNAVVYSGIFKDTQSAFDLSRDKEMMAVLREIRDELRGLRRDNARDFATLAGKLDTIYDAQKDALAQAERQAKQSAQQHREDLVAHLLQTNVSMQQMAQQSTLMGQMMKQSAWQHRDWQNFMTYGPARYQSGVVGGMNPYYNAEPSR